jgi:hypothetical protein
VAVGLLAPGALGGDGAGTGGDAPQVGACVCGRARPYQRGAVLHVCEQARGWLLLPAACCYAQP